jgi:polar amino acid transport system substrate-binding protein/cystine transport system substrate-binding protein/membrane-bound lytic murein transglycosylase F
MPVMPRLPGKLRSLLPHVLIFGLLGGVYLLPPDTSLREVRKAGVLRACLPPDYPPLVTGDRDAPGIDVELLQALAKGLGVRLVVTSNPAMGQDFNPRNWHVTRAQCEVLGGGVVVSPTTKSFLETSPSYAQTGWALVAPKLLAPKLGTPEPPIDLAGRRVGILTGISGLDRLALSRHLRERNAQVTIVSSPAELVQGLRDGRFDVAVTEWLLAGQLAAREGFGVTWAAADLPRYPVALGLWKGDLTLKRAIADGMEELRRNGEMARIIARYVGEARTSQLLTYSPRTRLASRP